MEFWKKIESRIPYKVLTKGICGSWRSLNNLNESLNKSRWWKDLRDICGYREKVDWFNNIIR